MINQEVQQKVTPTKEEAINKTVEDVTGGPKIGEAGPREAGLSSALSRRFLSMVAKAGKHVVEPVEGGRTNLSVKMQHDPQLRPAPVAETAAETSTEIIPALDLSNTEQVAARINTATAGDFNDNETHYLNFDKIESDDIIKTIAILADDNKDAINDQRRNVVSNDALFGMAKVLRSDPEFIKELM